jgi:hypothetical protein
MPSSTPALPADTRQDDAASAAYQASLQRAVRRYRGQWPATVWSDVLAYDDQFLTRADFEAAAAARAPLQAMAAPTEDDAVELARLRDTLELDTCEPSTVLTFAEVRLRRLTAERDAARADVAALQAQAQLLRTTLERGYQSLASAAMAQTRDGEAAWAAMGEALAVVPPAGTAELVAVSKAGFEYLREQPGQCLKWSLGEWAVYDLSGFCVACADTPDKALALAIDRTAARAVHVAGTAEAPAGAPAAA